MSRRHRPSTAATAAALPLVLLATYPHATVQTSRRLDAHPPHNTHILHEESIPDAPSSLHITSNVPVTIQRLHPHAIPADPSSPEVRVIVTSDCDTTQTTAIPHVETDGGGGSIHIRGGGGSSPTTFLESTWYHAAWSHVRDGCYKRLLQGSTTSSPFLGGGDDVTTTTTTPPPMDTSNNYCGMSWADAYANCPLPCPAGNDDCIVLGDGYVCQIFTTCYDRIQSGTFTPTTDGGVGVGGSATVASSNEGVTVGSTVQGGTIIATLPTPDTTFTTQGAITIVSGANVGNGTEDNSTNTTTSSTVPMSTQVNIFETTQNATASPETDSIAATTSPNTTVSNSTNAIPSSTIGATANTSTTATNIPTSTEPSSSQSDTTTNTTTNVKPTTPPAIDNFPTYQPTASHAPSTWTYTPTYLPTSDSTTFRSTLLPKLITLLLLLLGTMAMVWSGGREDAMVVGHGKIAVAVTIVASFYSTFRGGGSLRNVLSSPVVPSGTHPTCTFHVDILVSCHHAIHVDAPASRVIRGGMEDVTFERDEEDECITNYNARLMFPSKDWILQEGSSTVLEPAC
ncbi:hypothetical protein HJC23_000188 [Cyclotella cryptica]|uniref:Uncharacterized protein n=1 Tax=Cyclotella cryptica TaxID=29204 RepID=A0ABD3QDX4_9STRA|eukprot:CCRYP_006372-RA/>CCRYP_006372-RA protein AED:0.26 eAED:0.26 QI:0/-1/0/1/-1/1/1/0/568